MNLRSLDANRGSASSAEFPVGLPPLSPQFQHLSEFDYILPFANSEATEAYPSILNITDNVCTDGHGLRACLHRQILDWIKNSVQHAPPLAFEEFETKIIQFNNTSFMPVNLYAPEARHELCRETLSVRMIHFVIQRLVDNKVTFWKLQEKPGNTSEHMFTVGIQYLHSLSATLLTAFLDSAPDYIRHSLELSLLCTAVELNAFRTANVLLQRGLNPNDISYIGDSGRMLLLERACNLHHVEITSVLLEHGANPSKFCKRSPLAFLLYGDHKTSRTDFSDDELDIIGLLLRSNGIISRENSSTIRNPQNLKLVHIILNNVVGANYHIFFEKNVFSSILRTEDEEIALLSVRDVLSRGWSEEIRRRKHFRSVLSAALINAVRHYRRETIERLVSAGAQVESNCFIAAVHSNKLEAISWCINIGLDANTVRQGRKPMEPLSYLDLDGSLDQQITPLSEAIRQNFQEAINVFEERGFVSRLRVSKEAFQAVMHAVAGVGNIRYLDELLSLAEESDEDSLDFPTGEFYRKAAHHAVHSEHRDVCLKLISAGVRLSYGFTDLFEFAIRSRDTYFMRLLLDMNLNRELEMTDVLVSELLEYDDRDMFKDVVKTLNLFNSRVEIKKTRLHLNPGERMASETTILGAAILENNEDAVEWLLGSCADIDSAGRPYLSPLAACIVVGSHRLLKDLLHRGMDPFDSTALRIAVSSQNLTLVNILLEAFVERYPAGQKGFGIHALFQAMDMGDWGLIKTLAHHTDTHCLSARLFDTTEEPYMISALGMAIGDPITQIHNIELVRFILKSGSDPNIIVSREGGPFTNNYIHRTALLHAIVFGKFCMVKELINFGADINLSPTLGILRTPLQCAAEYGKADIVQYLLQQGADPNQRPARYSGGTALQLAAIKGYAGIAAILIDLGADINAAPAMVEGRTAFEGATEYGRITLMLYLVDHGANLLANDGRQYKRAVKFGRKNHQLAAVKLAEKLYQQALDNASSLAATFGISDTIGAEDLNFTDFLNDGSGLG